MSTWGGLGLARPVSPCRRSAEAGHRWPENHRHFSHIALASGWGAAKAAGECRVSTLGASLDGVDFVHGSFRQQVERIGALLETTASEAVSSLGSASQCPCTWRT